MNSESHREFHAKAAKKLLRLLRAREPSALLRVRAVLHDTRGQSDDDVVTGVGLMRCQHVVAKEAGCENWKELMSGPTSAMRGTPSVDSMRSPPSRPSGDEDEFEALLFDLGSRVLRTKSFDHVRRAQESIQQYFASQVRRAPALAIQAAATDAGALLTYRTTPVLVVNGKPRPSAPTLNKDLLSPEDQVVYSSLMAECARFVEARERDFLGNVATSVAQVREAIRLLPDTAPVGTKLPVEAGGFLHHHVKGPALTVLGPPTNHWTLQEDGWHARVVVHVDKEVVEALGGRGRLEPWLATALPCRVELLYFDGEFAHLDLVVRESHESGPAKLEDFARAEAQLMVNQNPDVTLVAVFRFGAGKPPAPRPGPRPVIASQRENHSAQLDVPFTGSVVTEGFVVDLDQAQRQLVEARYPTANVVTWHPVDR